MEVGHGKPGYRMATIRNPEMHSLSPRASKLRMVCVADGTAGNFV
jgi:hypothetical protein